LQTIPDVLIYCSLRNILPAASLLFYRNLEMCLAETFLLYTCILLVILLDLHLFDGRFGLKWRTARDSDLCIQTARTFWTHKEGRECYLTTQLLACSLLTFISLSLSPPIKPVVLWNVVMWFCCRQLV